MSLKPKYDNKPRFEWQAEKEEKKSYLLRKQQEEEAKRQLREAFAEDFPNTWNIKEHGPNP